MSKAKLMPLRVPCPSGSGETYDISPMALLIKDPSWFTRILRRTKYIAIIRRTSITEHKNNKGELSGIQVHHQDEDPIMCKNDRQVAKIISELAETFEFPDNELPVIFPPGDNILVLDAEKVISDPYFLETDK